MNIFVLADPDLPVPPLLYGGIERVVSLLAEGLHARGHSVTLFAHQESRVTCRLRPWIGAAPWTTGALLRNAALVGREVSRERPSIIHCFARLACLASVLPLPVPKIMSYQRIVTARSVRRAHRVSRGSLTFTGCSERLIDPVRTIGRWRVLYNAAPVDRFPYGARVSAAAPLVCLGRIEEIKGTHLAIEVAHRAGRPLVIAGNVPREHETYFRERVQPHVDGSTVSYVGPVDDAAKSGLLSAASALLMPVQWDEPFGIVMAESLACGTPVIGLDRGAIPEVVDHGVTGFVCRDVDEMVDGVLRLDRIARAACRRAAEARFSPSSLIDACEHLYLECAGEAVPGQSARAAGGSSHIH